VLSKPRTVDSSSQSLAKELFKLLAKYSPETKKDKKARHKTEAEAKVKAAAEAKAKGEAAPKDKPKEPSKKPLTLKQGLNHVTALVENDKAKLVVIAHNVEPIELVLHLPALCRKKNIPFCVVKGKGSRGT
jgi:large subunit ribosomal protein L7Ae